MDTSASKEIEKALFDAASGISDRGTREAFLDQACNGNAVLRRRLGGLLEASEEADDFFTLSEKARTMVAAFACEDDPARPLPDHGCDNAASVETSEGPGTRIGRYRILERIGEGGCGVVYLAEQQEPVQRLVALKVIRLGMDTESVIARFEIERQSLAVMDHPNIAHVLDAGATETGRPYFVMEWVRGIKITDYCNENRLDVLERVNLFIEVCNAIQHAHQKGVIHRDIKPSNVLVTKPNDRPAPKVIDFGIAKATAGKSVGDTMLTAREHFIGTPAYMSPEQADRRSLDVDTRSDVYSLGILLYELLAGRPPFDPRELSSAGLLETRRLLTEHEPPRPSALLGTLSPEERAEVAARHRAEPAKLISLVKGDLDWVVMKAIEKDRQRRYETVNGLAMDLRRFIQNEPVMARPPGRIYLIRKFVRRNRLSVTAAAGIAAALVLGLGLAYGSYLRERRATQEQARLRLVAEAARSNEEKLSENASIRENIAQVAVLMSEGRIEEADARLRLTPLATIEPSLEAASVLRSLGGWNAMRGRWPQAAECLLLLTQANRWSTDGQIISSSDIVAAGAALAEHGNTADYARFREWAMGRFATTTDTLAAEQVMQATLLLPADEGFLGRLKLSETLLEQSGFEKRGLRPGWETEFATWRAWTLSLMKYRSGDWQQSIRWGKTASEYRQSKKALSAAIHSVLAMAYHRGADPHAAKTELERAQQIIGVPYDAGLAPVYEPMGSKQGFWWDWVQARLLFREAEFQVGGHGE